MYLTCDVESSIANQTLSHFLLVLLDTWYTRHSAFAFASADRWNMNQVAAGLARYGWSRGRLEENAVTVKYSRTGWVRSCQIMRWHDITPLTGDLDKKSCQWVPHFSKDTYSIGFLFPHRSWGRTCSACDPDPTCCLLLWQDPPMLLIPGQSFLCQMLIPHILAINWTKSSPQTLVSLSSWQCSYLSTEWLWHTLAAPLMFHYIRCRCPHSHGIEVS